MFRLIPLLAALLLSTPVFAEMTDYERNFNYQGHDIRRDVNVSVEECRTRCNNLAACRAYTWVPANVQGPQPVCWLKNAHGNPTVVNGLISGRKHKWECQGWCHCNDGSLKYVSRDDINYFSETDQRMADACGYECPHYRVQKECYHDWIW